jgi:hypothetical protein
MTSPAMEKFLPVSSAVAVFELPYNLPKNAPSAFLLTIVFTVFAAVAEEISAIAVPPIAIGPPPVVPINKVFEA